MADEASDRPGPLSRDAILTVSPITVYDRCNSEPHHPDYVRKFDSELVQRRRLPNG